MKHATTIVSGSAKSGIRGHIFYCAAFLSNSATAFKPPCSNKLARMFLRSRLSGEELIAWDNTSKASYHTELEIAAAWRRTQQMLDVHLRNSGALAEAEGTIVRSGIGLLAIPQATSGARGRVSDHRLSQFSGLEEGFKVLSA